MAFLSGKINLPALLLWKDYRIAVFYFSFLYRFVS